MSTLLLILFAVVCVSSTTFSAQIIPLSPFSKESSRNLYSVEGFATNQFLHPFGLSKDSKPFQSNSHTFINFVFPSMISDQVENILSTPALESKVNLFEETDTISSHDGPFATLLSLFSGTSSRIHRLFSRETLQSDGTLLTILNTKNPVPTIASVLSNLDDNSNIQSYSHDPLFQAVGSSSSVTLQPSLDENLNKLAQIVPEATYDSVTQTLEFNSFRWTIEDDSAFLFELTAPLSFFSDSTKNSKSNANMLTVIYSTLPSIKDNDVHLQLANHVMTFISEQAQKLDSKAIVNAIFIKDALPMISTPISRSNIRAPASNGTVLYSYLEVVTYQIYLWVSILMVIITYMVVYFFYSMEVESVDPVLFRPTIPQYKRSKYE